MDLDALEILLVEDNPGDARLVQEALKELQAHRLVLASTLAEAEAELAENDVNCVLLDLGLPDATGLEGVHRLQASHPDLPLIVLTGHDDEDTALGALHAGAQDYLAKDSFTPEVLARAVRYACERKCLENEKAATTEALEASRKRYRQIVETSFEGILALDAEGITTFANERIAAILKTVPERMTGTSIFDLVTDLSRSDASHSLTLARTGSSARREMTFIAQDGSEVPVLLAVAPLIGDDGCYSGALAMVSDLTHQKTAEQESARLEQQLRQAQKMEAVGQLAGGIAHDFNNLLAVIMNYSSFLLEDMESGSEHRDDVAQISTAAQSGAALIRQLLAFSRKEIIRPEVVDVNAVVSRMEGLLARTLGEDVALELTLASDLGQATLDRGQMEQVLVNLAVNARDAMPGGGTLSISTQNVTVDEAMAEMDPGLRPGDYVRLAVSDTGTGMTEETKERLFEPFFTTKPRGKGTGLGMATVYGMVKRSEGYISVSSELGTGSRFHIYLPRNPDQLHSAREGAPADQTLASSTSRRRRVLVVEDEDGVRNVIERILRANAIEVLAASGWVEARELYMRHQGPIDMLLTDVIMPEASGKEVAQRLADLGATFPTIFMSGYTDDIVAKRGVVEAGEHFIQKPFTSRQLLDAVEKALGDLYVAPASALAATVLLVDDDEAIRDVVRLMLEQSGFEVVAEAHDEATAVKAALETRPAVVVLDYLLERVTGDKVAARLREVSKSSRILALSAVLEQSPEWADAFLGKARLAHLPTTVKELIGVGRS